MDHGNSIREVAASTAEVDGWLRGAIEEGPDSWRAAQMAKRALSLDDLNWEYFRSLYERKLRPRGTSGLQIHEDGKAALPDREIAWPTSSAPAELLRHLRIESYPSLRDPSRGYAEAARGTALWLKKMQAGTGSSMSRTSYLARELGIPESRVTIGAKGTDLFVEIDGRRVSLAELQILQAIHNARSGGYGAIILHDIVSSETETAVAELWRRKSILDPSKTYAELVEETPGLSRFSESRQSHVPTLDESGTVSFNRFAPAGHALFGVEALRAAYLDELRPRAEGKKVIAAIANGEDVNSVPDPFILGWMAKERVPIAIVTTEKLPVDAKGGLLGLVPSERGGARLVIIETAQAKETGQLALFERLGGIANTNLALFNYDELSPRIRALVKEVGEREFMRIIAPDLISNWKEQKDADGVVRKYLQLEGAMGSTLMNLDRWWRENRGEPLVSVIVVPASERTELFSPVKSAFDCFMQFHSDRFSIDPGTFRLVNHRPGELPVVSLADPATGGKQYADVQNVLDSFGGASIRGLDRLTVEGQVAVRGMILRGEVRISNSSGKRFDLTAWARHRAGALPTESGRFVLENIAVTIAEDGQVHADPIARG